MREHPLQYASTDKNKKSHYNIIVIGNVYRPPDQDVCVFNKYFESLLNSGCLYQWESRDSSATRIFFKKK